MFLLQFTKAVGTKATIKQFTDVVHLIQVELNSMALTFSATVGFALDSGATSLTRNKFVFDHLAKIRQIKMTTIKKEQNDLLLVFSGGKAIFKLLMRFISFVNQPLSRTADATFLHAAYRTFYNLFRTLFNVLRNYRLHVLTSLILYSKFNRLRRSLSS
jgi:hypothetical protein